MKYHVYFSVGSCNQGDHEVGLQEFHTLAEAQLFVADLEKKELYGSAVIVHGEQVESHNW